MAGASPFVFWQFWELLLILLHLEVLPRKIGNRLAHPVLLCLRLVLEHELNHGLDIYTSLAISVKHTKHVLEYHVSLPGRRRPLKPLPQFEGRARAAVVLAEKVPGTHVGNACQ